MGEQRFKVGDWVRVKDNRGAPQDYKVGEVRQVTKIYDGIVRCGSAGMFHYRFEPWQPRVGERVRVNFAGWEGEGEVTAEEKYGIALVKMKEGTYAGTEGGFLARDLKPILTATATATPEQPATLKIEEGKFYKTRDGRKVGPMKAWSTGGWCSEGKFDTGLWLNDGQPKYSMAKDSPALVAEWIAEPAVEAKASNDNAKPKFKVGDRVELARSFYGAAKVGATATVGQRGMFDGFVDIIWDKTSLHQGQMDGGYSPDYFELLPSTSAIHTTIVALIENGQPKPSSTPHVHASTAAAEKEAKRLAAKFKGKQFGVFTLTTTHEEAAPVYDHKWQNMAAMGLKIDAIKELRSITGMGLKPAKDAVEYFLAAA